jgi:hypothetical protein
MTPAERETMSAALEIATRGLSETEAYHVGMVIWDMCRYRDKPLERLQEARHNIDRLIQRIKEAVPCP